MTSTTPAFEAHGLVKRFGSTVALDGVDLAAEAGSVLGVLGPNGAGKTTALRVLATLVRPDAGTARVGGFDVLRDPGRVRRLIGLTGQFAAVDEDLTGRENLVLIGRLLDLTGRAARERAAELLDVFELTEAADRLARTYSGGMRRRLDLGASLIGRPQVIFLDEPTTGLDPSKRDDVWRIVRDLAAQGSSILLTTQYLEEADALAHEISVFARGRVIAHGTPAQLKSLVGSRSIAVRVTRTDDLDAVREVLSDLTGRRPDGVGRDVLTVPVETDAVFAAVVARLAERGIAASELSLRLPSLDEVFFALTGSHDIPDAAETSVDTREAVA
jgi:oleandomycin transport system ATP-binding protein